MDIAVKDNVEPASTLLRHRRTLPALTGLRFLAAFSVAFAHGISVTFRISDPSQLFSVTKYWLAQVAGIGMPLFFVLSGFVIHYNYRTLISTKGVAGFTEFLWARFSRLYPLFIVFLVCDFFLSPRTYNSVAYDRQDILSGLAALPYFLTFTQSWIYSLVHDHILIFRLGSAMPLTWSISTEWFFYLCYPAVMLFVMRVKKPVHVIGLALAWSLIWGTFAHEVSVDGGPLQVWAAHYFGVASTPAYNLDEFFARWLEYYSPYMRIGEFVLGCIVAQLFLSLENKKPDGPEQAIALIGVVIAIVSVPFLMYMMYNPEQNFWIRSLNNNYGLAPSLGIILFCAARYDFGILRWLSSRPIVRLGEASYSIYLTHMLVFMVVCGSQGPLPGDLASSLYLYARLVVALAVIFLLSNALFVRIENPARLALRAIWRKPGFPLMPAIVNAGALVAAAVLIVQNGFVIAQAGRSVTSIGVQIESATYGGSCGAAKGNVTLKVQAECQGRAQCIYVVNAARIGDPAAGCAKSFAVSFTCAPYHDVHTVFIPGEAGLGSVARLVCEGNSDKSAN